MNYLFLTHLFATIFMTGLIWTMQVVHYPLLGEVGETAFINYEIAHQRLISLVVIPIMLLELGTGGLLIVANETMSRSWLISSLGLLLLIWLSTFVLQGPMHTVLAEGFDKTVHRNLVASNWIRTILWTTRSFILLWLLAAQLNLDK